MSKQETSVATDLVTAARMRAVERSAIESGSITGAMLMDRAGRGVVAAIHARYPALAADPGRAVVFCGPGNNGGDGYVIARLLDDWGWRVEVWGLGDAARLPPDARANCNRWCDRGVVRPLDAAGVRAALSDAPPGLFVDALFGTGLTRPLSETAVQALAEVATSKARDAAGFPSIAVDIPSGLCSESGRNLGNPCRADLTVTFHAAKPGHYLDDGPALCGALAVADIGLRGGAPPAATVPGTVRLVGPPRGLGKRGGHKYDHGHAMILSGGLGRSGAARLAARGALRIGAGLVTVAAPQDAMAECAAQLTAVMLRRCDDAGALRDDLARDVRITALCLGPGLGLDARAAGLVEASLALVAGGSRGLVLDADALMLFADRPEWLFEGTRAAGRAVLTPHDGEFSRLFPDLGDRLGARAPSEEIFSRLDAVRAAADRAGCTVLLKGAATVIAAPDGAASLHPAVYDRAVPWLATAGAGDVLAGLIAGLLARGWEPRAAAEAAVWLHVEAARAVGPGLIAEDLPDALPAVLRAVRR
jgi:hydroxyethylthiazole kinase-like uncharacterized protein yjeF